MEESEPECVIEHKVSADCTLKIKSKPRGKKRKRSESESGSESDDGLPENAFEVEKNVVASAVKNNLDDVSVKKILKKVVTNDHVLALVKLREEEESNTEESKLIPKLTRSKVKELTKVSPKSAPWNIQNLELTPIKHIPVKTRPEVKALIAQELPEDEDDEEYKPAHDEVPSDDDQGLESCSDLDSQPRTPATPRSQQKTSPKVVKDGPFKVPQDIQTPTRRKLDMAEEEATIALRTRSKFCLSETSIEHIESSFVPPDDLPLPVDDHLWNDFLNECLNPASVSKNEDDDETDPEYNVAADPDAPDDDDEEALERGIIKISKKELNDLVTELFNIIPEGSVDDELANMAANGVLADNVNNQNPPHWEGKQEPVSGDEGSVKIVDRIVFERRSSITKISVGKMEEDLYEEYDVPETPALGPVGKKEKDDTPDVRCVSNMVEIQVEESPAMGAADAPAPVRQLRPPPATHTLQVLLTNNVILPEQIQILQQQLRQHIQLATSNFLQLCVHPIHWALGPTYKEYIDTLVKIGEDNHKSVVNVCNLKPAMELCETWEKTVSEDTLENKKMVEYIQSECDRCQRRIANNSLYVGQFHETLMRTVANSPVFVYPFLLPAMPYRAVTSRRFSYLRSEDALIAIGLDQFWEYVESNPDLYKRPARPRARTRWGLSHAVELVHKHLVPWLSPKVLMGHIMKARVGDKDNPIYKFFKDRTVEPARHRLLPFNPALTLYEQPEHEMPRIWLRYLAKTSRRFHRFLHRRRSNRSNFIGEAPDGIDITACLPNEVTPKAPLPIDFTKEIVCNRINSKDPSDRPPTTDKFDLHIQRPSVTDATPNFYKLVETSLGVNLVPLKVMQTITPEATIIGDTNTVTCNIAPISSSEVKNDYRNIECDTGIRDSFHTSYEVPLESPDEDPEHCRCCVLLRSICKKQMMITDYFKSSKVRDKPCRCKERRSPNVSNRLRLLVDRYKQRQSCVYRDLMRKLEPDEDSKKNSKHKSEDGFDSDSRTNEEDAAIVTAYQIKLTLRSLISKNVSIKRRVSSLFAKFDPDSDDALALADQLESCFKVDLVDLHREFIGFLTAEQADRLGRFKDYFTLNCVDGLVKKVEEQVKEKDVKDSILRQLSEFFSGSWTACGMCRPLILRMRRYPALAAHTFRLFPHRAYRNPAKCKSDNTAKPTALQASADEDMATDGEPALAHSTVDYEADHSSSGEEGEAESLIPRPFVQMPIPKVIKTEPSLKNVTDAQPISCKIEPNDSSESEMSMMIMSEDEPIKTEPLEWKRDEDKLILEVLKLNLTPEERKDKTILEILEEKQVLEVLTQSLTNKSTEAVHDRILYLLNVLLIGET